ncbi:MAG: serine/threonine protein kinase [Anaerolineae bacterium]
MTHTISNSNSTFPYTKKQMIGSGGTAVVYLAEDHETGKDVAIKMIAKSVSAEQRFRARFEREITMLKSVSHPNILPVLNHGETDGQLYMVMPYVSGGSVRDLLEEGPVSWEQTLSIMEQVCPALDAMHEMGFIHRDIKPHNILVGEDGGVMLSDFGISRPIEESEDNSVTHTLDIVGTPGFIAPEQAAKGELSAQTDIYQLGVTTFYMLTGERLFEGSTLEVIAKHIGEKPGSAGDLVNGLPRNIDAVLHMALAKDPKNRFRTASDFLGALNLLSDQNTVTFQHLPGFPVRTTAPSTVPSATPAYEAVVPVANGRGFSAEAQNEAQSTITPSAAPAATSRKRRPLVRYAVAGFSIVALIIAGFFFIPGALDGGNGGGNGRGNGGNGNGGRGGQGNAADNAPTLVENSNDGILNEVVVQDVADNNEAVAVAVDQTEAELPALANDTEIAFQVVSAITDDPVAPAPEPVENNDNGNTAADPIPETDTIVDAQADPPTAADADNNGDDNNNDGRGNRNGNGGADGNNNNGDGNGNNGQNDGNPNGGRGNGNGGNNGNGNGRGNGGRGGGN